MNLQHLLTLKYLKSNLLKTSVALVLSLMFITQIAIGKIYTIDDVSSSEGCTLSFSVEVIDFPGIDCRKTFYIDNFSVEGEYQVVEFTWDFGDGSTSTGGVQFPYTYPDHIYSADGMYNVCLTVTYIGNEGEECSTEVCTTTIVEGCDPQTCEDCEFEPGTLISFDDLEDGCERDFYIVGGVISPPCSIVDYNWSFGDGFMLTTTAGQSTHTYDEAGEYNVCVTINYITSEGKRCSDQICELVEENCVTPCGSCEFSPGPMTSTPIPSTEGCYNLVSFDDLSLSSSCTLFGSFLWTVNGGDPILGGPKLFYDFGGHGEYTICATINYFNEEGVGCQEEVCQTITIGCFELPGFQQNTGGSLKNELNLSLFPNPTSDELNIQIGTVDQKNVHGLLQIISMTGESVKTIRISEKMTKVSLSEITTGNYILKFTSDDGQTTGDVLSIN